MFLRSSVDMGESAFRRLKLCTDGSHWLDTLSVSNSSSRNWNNWFVAMITSLNIVAKTFAKIAKTFARLSATIIATRRRLVLILHLETKYAKMDCKNEIYAKKLDKEHLDCKSQLLQKSQRSKSTQVNSLSTMTSADVMDDIIRWWTMMSAGDVAVMMSPRIDVN